MTTPHCSPVSPLRYCPRYCLYGGPVTWAYACHSCSTRLVSSTSCLPLSPCRASAVIASAADEQRGVARPWPGGDTRIRGRASPHEAWEALASFLLPGGPTGVSRRAVGYLRGATPRGQPWTSAVSLPPVRHGLGAGQMAALSTFRARSLGRHVHRE